MEFADTLIMLWKGYPAFARPFWRCNPKLICGMLLCPEMCSKSLCFTCTTMHQSHRSGGSLRARPQAAKRTLPRLISTMMRWQCTRDRYWSAGLNSLVHVFMYTYYCCAALKIDRRYLKWAKYLTMFQMMQFVSNMAQSAYDIVFPCPYCALAPNLSRHVPDQRN